MQAGPFSPLGPLTEIRQATQDLHRKLDEGSLAKVLLSSTLSITEYSSFLSSSRKLHLSFHRELLRFWDEFKTGYSFFDRLAALDRDLQSCGLYPLPTVISDFQPPVTPGARWGLAYVIEGSRLGGQVLARKVRAALGDAGVTVYYLEGTGSKTGEEWKAFCKALTAFFDENPGELASAKEYAKSVFGLFIRTFTVGTMMDKSVVSI